MEAANNGERHPAELKKQMREDKQREAKIQEQLNKQLNGLSLEEKFNLVYKRLVESEKENKRLVQLHKQYERSMEATKKERENMILEHSKTANTKSKLEQLCRELQKQNRMIKDESMARIKEEEEKRRETQAKFQKSLNEIQAVMDENHWRKYGGSREGLDPPRIRIAPPRKSSNYTAKPPWTLKLALKPPLGILPSDANDENNQKNQQLKDDNMEMAKKFKFILEQYELRDQQMDKMNKQMDLVTQLNEAKLAKANMEAAAEKEKFLAEKEIIINELTKVKKQLADLQMVEVHLREQVNMYSDKYGEFQDSLKKSHNIFVGYKGDMEKMSKKIRTLEKETITWKTKWERSNAALIDLMSEKQVRDEHIMKTARQLFQLQKLCRTLQNERTAYFKALEDNKVEIPQIVEVPSQMPEPEPLPVPTKKQEDRLEIMTKSCSALKENLAALQGQLSAIQNVEPKKEETPVSVNGQTQPQGKKGKKDKKGKGAKTVEPEPEGNQKTNGVEGDNSNSTVEAAAPTQAVEPTKSVVDETLAEEPKPESTEEEKPAAVVETTKSATEEQPQPASEAVQQAEPAVVVAT